MTALGNLFTGAWNFLRRTGLYIPLTFLAVMTWRAPYADPRDWDYDEGINLMKVLLVQPGLRALHRHLERPAAAADRHALGLVQALWGQRCVGPRADPALLGPDPVEPLPGSTQVGLRVCRRRGHAAAGAQRVLHPPQRRGDGRSAGPGAGVAGRGHPGDGRTPVVAHRAVRHLDGAGTADQALRRRHGTGSRRLFAL